MRTIIKIPNDVVESLDQLANSQKRSRAAVIREALAEYLHKRTLPPGDAAFGLWKKKQKDGIEYQNELRSEWRTQ